MLLGEFDQGECLWLQSKSERAALERLRLRCGQRGGFAERLDLRERGKRGPAHFFPGGERRAVIFVDDGDTGGLCTSEPVEMQRDGFR